MKITHAVATTRRILASANGMMSLTLSILLNTLMLSVTMKAVTVKQLKVGDTMVWLGMNGHVWENEVSSVSEKYGPSAPQWNARHSDECGCHGAEDAEDVALYENW